MGAAAGIAAILLLLASTPAAATSQGTDVPCERYDEDGTPDARTYGFAKVLTPTPGPVPDDGAVGVTLGSGAGEQADAYGYGTPDDGPFVVSATGVGPVEWTLLIASGPEAGEVLASGSLDGVTPPTTLFDAPVDADRTCFVVEPGAEDDAHYHEFIFGTQVETQMVEVTPPTAEDVLDILQDPWEICATLETYDGSPAELNQKVEVCTPEDPLA